MSRSMLRHPRSLTSSGRVYLLFLLLATTLGLTPPPLGATVPAGFTDALVAAVSLPTALAFTPDGRLLITQQSGSLRVFTGGSLLATPALTLSAICTNSERGLLGVAVDPDYPTSPYVYLYYTFRRADTTCVNRVSRFTLPVGNVIDPSTELVLLDNMPSTAGNHNGGDVEFGPDGFLYVSIGDGGCDYADTNSCGGSNDASRDQNVLTGKVMRITKTGDIPATNPFQGAGTARCNTTGSTTIGNKCQETFAWGFRNPFRIAFDPNSASARLFINDVGQSAWEEIDLGQSGADYGWNCREGRHTNNTSGPCSPTPPALVEPIFEYAHSSTVPGTTSSGCNSITGGAFVPNGLWPGFDGVYLFSDFICGAIFRMADPGSGFAAADFAKALGSSSVVALRFGPFGSTQALYYTTLGGGGQVRRISLDTPPPPTGLDYFTLTPCRLADTRLANGPLGGPALAGGATRNFTAAGTCGIPSGAVALALNLTVVSPNGPGSVTAFPAGTAVPPTSVVNFSAGQIRASEAVIGLSGSGGLGVFCGMAAGRTTHLVIDVVGYFE